MRPSLLLRGFLVAWLVAVSACARDATPGEPTAVSAASRLLPDPDRLSAGHAELRQRLAASPIAFFRFVNQAWTREVCDAFAGDLDAMPTARLHGDAHMEQYAVTDTEHGLDDFDDSATGPAIVDLVRFLGSLGLTVGERGWMASLPAIEDAFLRGYRQALENPDYQPREPAVVLRLRASAHQSAAAFLSWADSLMQPISPADLADVETAWERIVAYAAKVDPEFTPEYLTRKKVGAFRAGIGSALARKVLIRVEGPSPALDDDVMIEAKEVTALRDQPCLSIPADREVFRVVEGLRQIGRSEHRLLVALPVLSGKRPDARGWWVKAWDRSYRELEISDLTSAEELREVAHDVGTQLGSTNFDGSAGDLAARKRQAELESVMRSEARIRQVAHDLTSALLEAWQRFRKSPIPDPR